MRHLFSFILFVVVTIVSCSVKGTAGQDGLATKDCSPDRKVIEKIIGKTVKLTSVIDELYLVPVDDDSKQFFACNLPKTYKEGDVVTVDLDVKEIFANERLAGTPVVITKLEK